MYVWAAFLSAKLICILQSVIWAKRTFYKNQKSRKRSFIYWEKSENLLKFYKKFPVFDIHLFFLTIMCCLRNVSGCYWVISVFRVTRVKTQTAINLTFLWIITIFSHLRFSINCYKSNFYRQYHQFICFKFLCLLNN